MRQYWLGARCSYIRHSPLTFKVSLVEPSEGFDAANETVARDRMIFEARNFSLRVVQS
jgi:hypothetical protein